MIKLGHALRELVRTRGGEHGRVVERAFEFRGFARGLDKREEELVERGALCRQLGFEGGREGCRGGEGVEGHSYLHLFAKESESVNCKHESTNHRCSCKEYIVDLTVLLIDL